MEVIKSCWFFVSLLIILIVVRIIHARNYDIVIQRIEGPEIDPYYVDSSSNVCVRKPTRTSVPGVNVLINITRPLPNDTRMSVKVYEMHNNQPRPSLIDYDKNLCEYLEKEKLMLLKTYAIAMRFPPNCPVLEHAYHTEHWTFEDNMLPPVLPGPNNWKLWTGLTLQGRSVFTFSGYAFIDRSKAAGRPSG